MVLGLLLIFCPALALQWALAPSLAGIWAAKAALNVWRLVGALWLVYGRFLPRFAADGSGGAGGVGSGGGAQGSGGGGSGGGEEA